jgi:predicted nucleic acid-binding protein
MKHVALDTGPLLLLAAGPDIAEKHKRMQPFGVAGCQAVTEFVAKYSALVATPHVLTEAWNFTGNDQPTDRDAQRLKGRLRSLFHRTVEPFVPAVELAETAEFSRLGLTDTALLLAAQRFVCPLITQDRGLWNAARMARIAAFHVEDLLLLSPYGRDR